MMVSTDKIGRIVGGASPLMKEQRLLRQDFQHGISMIGCVPADLFIAHKVRHVFRQTHDWQEQRASRTPPAAFVADCSPRRMVATAGLRLAAFAFIHAGRVVF